jgi:type I restriction enzyme S subunit
VHLVPVDTYLTFGNGKKRPADEGNGTFNVFGSNGVIGHCDEFNNPAGTIIIGRVGSYCGSVHYSPEQCWVTDNAIKGTAKTGADARYCYYLLLTRDLHSLRGGSGQPLINQTSLKSLEVPERSFADQKAIAHILGTLDDKIELNQKMNQTLEEIAKAIFKSWFVDFDPVRAKAEGRPTGLPSEISDLFPDELVDLEIGEIPKGWEVKTISDLADCVGGATPSTKNPEFWEGGHHTWTSPKDLSDSKSVHLLKTDRKITEAGLKKISSGLLPVGTVLLSSRAPVGYLALTTEPTAINQGYIGLKPKSGISNYFLLHWCEYNLDEIKNRASGTTFAEISKAAFRPIPAIQPSDFVMQKFHEFMAPIYERVLISSKEMDTLAELRDTLLPKLISGELRIPDAEKFLEEAGI